MAAVQQADDSCSISWADKGGSGEDSSAAATGNRNDDGQCDGTAESRACKAEELGVPSFGSRHHTVGRCKPCAFHHRPGCTSGASCPFCHLCPPFEKLRRKRLKQQLSRNIMTNLERGDGNFAKDREVSFRGTHSRQSSTSSTVFSGHGSTASTATPGSADCGGSLTMLGQPLASAISSTNISGASGHPVGVPVARGVQVGPRQVVQRKSQNQRGPQQQVRPQPRRARQAWGPPVPGVAPCGVTMQPVGCPTMMPVQMLDWRGMPVQNMGVIVVPAAIVQHAQAQNSSIQPAEDAVDQRPLQQQRRRPVLHGGRRARVVLPNSQRVCAVPEQQCRPVVEEENEDDEDRPASAQSSSAPKKDDDAPAEPSEDDDDEDEEEYSRCPVRPGTQEDDERTSERNDDEEEEDDDEDEEDDEDEDEEDSDDS